MIFELAQDFRDAVAAMPREHPKHRMLALLGEAVRRDIHFIARHPTTLFQCMWNTCWWYDCPEAERRAVTNSAPTNSERVGVRSAGMHRLMERWRVERRRANMTRPWLRACLAPRVPLGGPLVAQFPAAVEGVETLCWLGSSGKLAGGSSQELHVWDAASLIEVGQFADDHGGAMFRAIVVSPDGAHVAGVDYDNSVRVFDFGTAGVLRALPTSVATVDCLTYDPRARWLYGVSERGIVLVWDPESGGLVKRFRLQRSLLERLTFRRADNQKPRCLACSDDGSLVAFGMWGGAIQVWETTSWKLIARFSGHNHYIGGLAFLGRPAGGVWLVSGSGDETVRIWDPNRSAEVRCLRGHSHRVTGVACHSRTSRIASCSHDHTVRLWDAETGEELNCFKGHNTRVERVAFSPDGKRIASGDIDGRVCIWDAEYSSGSSKGATKEWTMYLGELRFSPEGHYLLYAMHDPGSGTTLSLRRTDDARLVATLACAVRDMLFLPGLQPIVALALTTGAIGLWEIETGKTRLLPVHGGEAVRLACSSDGRYLASALNGVPGWKASLRIWRMPTGEEWATFPGYDESISDLGFSPDGTLLASACSRTCTDVEPDLDVRVWDVERRQQRFTCQGHTRLITTLAFSPDGRWLASAAYDETVRVWDARSGASVHCFTDVITPVGQLAFSEDGRELAAQSMRTLKPELIQVWDIATGMQVDIQEARTDVTTYLRKKGLRCLVHPEAGQWVLLVIDPGGNAIAAVPSGFDLGQTHPLGLSWAWRTGSHIEWFQLEVT